MSILSQNCQQWLSVKEYAEKYRVVPLTVYRLVAANKVSHKRLGGAIRVLDLEIPLSDREKQKRRAAI